jgi:hypothetical protein
VVATPYQNARREPTTQRQAAGTPCGAPAACRIPETLPWPLTRSVIAGLSGRGAARAGWSRAGGRDVTPLGIIPVLILNGAGVTNRGSDQRSVAQPRQCQVPPRSGQRGPTAAASIRRSFSATAEIPRRHARHGSWCGRGSRG